jgi:threonine dehydrogenase-like Zn-dependent dehydrogenase
MKAVAWHGKRDVRVDTVPDPAIEEPTDAIVRVTRTAICGSDLHLYEVLGPFIDEGDIRARADGDRRGGGLRGVGHRAR